MQSVIKLISELGLNAAPYKAGVKDAKNATTGLEATVVKLGNAMKVAFTVTAITAFGKKMIEFGTKASQAAENIGITTGEMLALQRVAIANSLTIDDMTRILSKLRYAQVEVARGSVELARKFDLVGVSVDELLAADPIELMIRFAEATKDSEYAAGLLAEVLGEKLGPRAVTALQGVEDAIKNANDTAGAGADSLRSLGDDIALGFDTAYNSVLKLIGSLKPNLKKIDPLLDAMKPYQNEAGDMIDPSKQPSLMNDWFNDNHEYTAPIIEDRSKPKKNELQIIKERVDAEKAALEAEKEATKQQQERERIMNRMDDIRKSAQASMGAAGDSISGRGIETDAIARIGGQIGGSRAGLAIEDRKMQIDEKRNEILEQMNEKIQELQEQLAQFAGGYAG